MSDTPEPATHPTSPATAAPTRVKPPAVFLVAAWVVIVAGIVFILATVFFAGAVIFGGHGCHHRWNHHGMYAPGGPPPGVYSPGGPGYPYPGMGPGGPAGPPGAGPGGPAQSPPTTAPPPSPTSNPSPPPAHA